MCRPGCDWSEPGPVSRQKQEGTFGAHEHHLQVPGGDYGGHQEVGGPVTINLVLGCSLS